MGNIIKSRAWLFTVACGTAVILSTSPALAAPQDAAPESAVKTQVQETETPQAEQTQETPETQEALESEDAENAPETSAEEDAQEESNTREDESEAEDPETEQDEDETEEAEPEETEASQEDIYTAPENKNHVNVSFQFTNASGTKPVYPVNLVLKEVDTGVKEKITIRSSGQIVELEHGDYQVASIKDGGSMPLVASGQTMSIYKNARYTIQFQQNRARKMFSDFLKDNILLIVVFLGAAALYNATIIKNFNKHPRR